MTFISAPGSMAADRTGRETLDSVDGYLAEVLSDVRPLRPSRVGLGEADGAILAEDVAVGDLMAGTPLGPAQIGLLAALGRSEVLARPRPRLTVLSAGNELVEPGTALAPGQVWESNSWMLAAAAQQAGCVTRRHPVVRDDADQVLTAVRAAVADADLLVTSGGISMGGEHDSIKAALRCLGTVRFRKVAMQPGTPQGFGTVGSAGTVILTLPGNPVSAFVSFCIFVVPAIGALQGRSRDEPGIVRAVLAGPVRSRAGRRSFISAVLDREPGVVTPSSARSTHRLTALAGANALIVVPEQVTALAAGDTVEVMMLPSTWSGGRR